MTELNWHKSSHSGTQGGACVEIATHPHGGRAIRDSKTPHHAPLHLTTHHWQTFLTSIKTGHYDT